LRLKINKVKSRFAPAKVLQTVLGRDRRRNLVRQLHFYLSIAKSISISAWQWN